MSVEEMIEYITPKHGHMTPNNIELAIVAKLRAAEKLYWASDVIYDLEQDQNYNAAYELTKAREAYERAGGGE